MKSYRYELVTAPIERPITLGDIKRWGTIETNENDTLLMDALDDAIDYAQRYLNSQLVDATYAVYYDCFDNVLCLPVQPVDSVTSIEYYDTENVLQTLSTDVYDVDTLGIVPGIVLKTNQTWPDTYDRIGAVKITYVAGYGGRSAVPGSVKRAILMLLRQWDENRENVSFANSFELPHSVEALLNKYRYHPGF